MLAAVIDGPGGVAVRDVPVPAADGLALVRVGQAGICGTDLKIASGGVPVPAGRVLGHEMSGWVARPGPRAVVPAGRPVLVNPAIFCGLCDLCRRDLPQLCRRGGLLGRDADGCFAEYVAVDETLLHPLPESVTAAEAALLQVLSTCVHAQSGLGPADSAVVVGLGVSGLLHVQLLRERALRFGATVVAAPEEAAAAVAEVTGGHGADLAIECVGSGDTLAMAMRLAGAGGTVVMFGIPPSADAMPTYDWYYKELVIRCPRAARPRDCDAAIRLSGRLDLTPLVTARFPLVQAAGALAAAGDGGQLKVVLDIGERGDR